MTKRHGLHVVEPTSTGVVLRSGVSHELTRAHKLAQLRAGKITTQDLCDADFILKTAAKFHGDQATYPCPICKENTVWLVYWVYGDELGKMGSTARTMEEIEVFAQQGKHFNVHRVEVCTHCGWNHLLQEYTAVPA